MNQTLGLKKLKSKPLLCPKTNKIVEAVYTNPNNSKVGARPICIDCLLSDPEVLKLRKGLYTVEEFYELVERQLELRANHSPEQAKQEVLQLLDAVDLKMEAFYKEEFAKAHLASISELKDKITEFSQELVGAFAEENSGQIAKEVQITQDNFQETLFEFYKRADKDKRGMLKGAIEKLGNDLRSEDEKLDAGLKGAINLLIPEHYKQALIAGSPRGNFNPDSHIVSRFANLQAFYNYSRNNRISVSFKVENGATLFGFSSYESQQETRVRYAISEGERETAQPLSQWETTTKTVNPGVNKQFEKQTGNTSPEMLNEPLSLQADQWYTITINIIDNHDLMTYWGTGPQQADALVSRFPTADGDNVVSFKNGLDDNSANGTYASLIPDLYIG